MSVDTPAQAGVSIDALLAAKEQRAARQADWLAHYQQPVISLTLVTPGAVKDSIRYRNMMGVALQACDQLLWKHRWQTLDRQVLWLRPGLKRCGAWRTRPAKSKRCAVRWSRAIRWDACGISM